MRIDIMERTNEIICFYQTYGQQKARAVNRRASLLFSTLFYVAASGGK